MNQQGAGAKRRGGCDTDHTGDYGQREPKAPRRLSSLKPLPRVPVSASGVSSAVMGQEKDGNKALLSADELVQRLASRLMPNPAHISGQTSAIRVPLKPKAPRNVADVSRGAEPLAVPGIAPGAALSVEEDGSSADVLVRIIVKSMLNFSHTLTR
jgi:hypothetical protein